jgi:inner membrane protein involved in colicin E2 resistance
MGFTTSQWIASVSLVVSIVFYFAATSGLKQNAFLFFFGVALTVLVVGMMFHLFQTFCS